MHDVAKEKNHVQKVLVQPTSLCPRHYENASSREKKAVPYGAKHAEVRCRTPQWKQRLIKSLSQYN